MLKCDGVPDSAPLPDWTSSARFIAAPAERVTARVRFAAGVQMPERFVALVWVGGGIGGYQGGYEDLPEELELFEAYDKAEAAGDVEAMVDLDLRIWVDGIGQPPDRMAKRSGCVLR